MPPGAFLYWYWLDSSAVPGLDCIELTLACWSLPGRLKVKRRNREKNEKDCGFSVADESEAAPSSTTRSLDPNGQRGLRYRAHMQVRRYGGRKNHNPPLPNLPSPCVKSLSRAEPPFSHPPCMSLLQPPWVYFHLSMFIGGMRCYRRRSTGKLEQLPTSSWT